MNRVHSVGLIRRRTSRPQHCTLAHEAFAGGLSVTTQCALPPLAKGCFEMFVELLTGGEARHGNYEVTPCITNQPFHRALHATDHNQSFAEVRLRFSSRMHQRNDYLPAGECRRPDIVLHNRVAGREPMFFFSRLKTRLAA